MKTNKLLKLVKWFCRKLTYNDLASAIIIFHDVLSKSRSDIDLKPEKKSPHYSNFRVDMMRPLVAPAQDEKVDWKILKQNREKATGKKLSPVRRRKNSKQPPSNCECPHCNAPSRFLYLNDGKKGNQVRCKICNKLSTTNRIRIENKAKYYCPHCNSAMFLWKSDQVKTIYKCPSKKCSLYLKNLNSLTAKEHEMRKDGNTSQFKLHYQYKDYHFNFNNLQCAQTAFSTKTNLSKVRNNSHTISLILTYFINLALSSRQTRDALLKIHDIKVSHQTIINYTNSIAALISDFVDKNIPRPNGVVAGDETYITVENRMQYTWFNIDAESKAICGYNLSGTRGVEPCLALLYNTYGNPEENPGKQCKYVADGLPSYDSAVMAYNKDLKQDKIIRYKVVGLENLNQESKDYRPFKQMIERLNRTYKFHTRPRSGFKTFDGAVALTILFVAYYNFMRSHSSLKNKSVPIPLKCLDGVTLYPQMWTVLLQQVA